MIKMVQTKGTKEWACKNINFSKGCSNSCQYCYARRMANRFGWKKWNDWVNMTNRSELAKKKFKKINGVIMSPSSHDITTKNVELAKTVFYHILEAGNEILIVSKPDPDVIRSVADHILDFKDQIMWRFTIGTLNDNVRQYWEPGAPCISDRLSILEELYRDGWETSVSLEPFLDNTLLKLIARVSPFISHSIWIGPMNKIHVPKELWSTRLTKLYSPENLYKLKRKIDRLNNPKIQFKDHFLTKIAKYIPEEESLEILMAYH